MYDFDKFWQETEQKPIPFRVFGKDETIPCSMPASVVLEIVRAHRQHGDKEMPESAQLEIAVSIFGEERVDEWSKKGLTIDQLGSMIKWAMEQYIPAKNVKASSEKK